MDKTIQKIIKIRKEIEKWEEDKLRAEIYGGMLRRWLDDLLEFQLYLIKNKEVKVLKRFDKIIKIVGNDMNLL